MTAFTVRAALVTEDVREKQGPSRELEAMRWMEAVRVKRGPAFELDKVRAKDFFTAGAATASLWLAGAIGWCTFFAVGVFAVMPRVEVLHLSLPEEVHQ